EEPTAAWIKGALEALSPPREASSNVVAVDFAARAGEEVSREPVTAEILEHIDLNSSRSEKETIHLALGFEGAAPAYEPGDSLEAFPAHLGGQQLTAIMRPLAPRAYSIASSRKEVADEAHLLVASVRYESRGRARSGVASTHVAERLKVGGAVKVRLKPNRH